MFSAEEKKENVMREQIPQDLLIDLVKAGDQNLVDILFEQNYSLDTELAREDSWITYADTAPGLVKGTLREDKWDTPLDEMSAYSGSFGDEQLEMDSQWAVGNLIDMLEDEKIRAFIEPYEEKGYGYYTILEEDEGIPDYHSAVVYGISEELAEEGYEGDMNIRKGSLKNQEYGEDVNLTEHHLNTLVHELILHGTGGSHVKYGGTWQGYAPEYDYLSRRYIEELEGNPILQKMRDQLKGMI